MWFCSSFIIIFSALLFLILTVVEGLDNSYRLPNTIRPLKYNLTIEPIFNPVATESIFTGSVSIQFTVIEDTNNITINARELEINETNTSVTTSKHREINIFNSIIDKEKQLYIIHLEEDLIKQGSYELKIYFYGNLTFDNVGFYLAKYKTAAEYERILAVTDFQPSGARKAFPCFDEPAYKANFIINVVRDKHHVSVSNEELNFTKYLGNDRFQDTYKQTVKMSTYLVAFAVSDYNFTMKRGKHRIITKHEGIDRGKVDYILSISENLMSILENFTAINYSLDKLDEFTVPSEYFIPGGMENWGLITISEENLYCYNSTLTTTFQLQKCTTFTTHEFSHQWFGNLVTPSWWKYLWLSEGLATYLEYYVTSLFVPSWKLMDQFILNVQQKSLEFDGNKVKEALNSEPGILGSLPSAVISYYKGACVIRMAKHFLTYDVFERGIRIYLQQNQFGVVEPPDLYNAFQQSLNEKNLQDSLNNFTVAEILSTWDSFSGYPLVNAYRDYENSSLTLIQSSFFPHNIFSYGHIWYIPISVVLQNNTSEGSYDNTTTTPDLWLTRKFSQIKNFTSDGWILINTLQAGYYRVNYDITNWERLSEFLYKDDFNLIHVINRAQLIDDAFNLAKWNYIPFEIPLNLSKYLTRETHYLPIATFLNNMNSIKSALTFTDIYKDFQNYIISVLNRAYNYLGFEEKTDDSHLDKLSRINILTWLCDMRYQVCRDLTLKKFGEWKSNKTSLSADMEVPVFCGAMQTGTTEDWNFLYEKYKSATEKDQKMRIFSSLGCSRNETILKNFLDILFAVNNTLSFNMRKNALEKLTQTSVQGIEVSFNYLISYISGIQSTDSKFLLKAVQTVCKYLWPMEVKKYLSKTNSSIHTHYALSSCLVYARANQDWISKGYVDQFSKWLLDYEDQMENITTSIISCTAAAMCNDKNFINQIYSNPTLVSDTGIGSLNRICIVGKYKK